MYICTQIYEESIASQQWQDMDLCCNCFKEEVPLRTVSHLKAVVVGTVQESQIFVSAGSFRLQQ